MNRYFITGGTGFALSALVDNLTADPDTVSVTLLTRGKRNLPYRDKVIYAHGDITEYTPPSGFYSHLIHGACDANDLLQPDQYKYYYTIVEGTRRIMSWAYSMRIRNITLISSGAVDRDTVYGQAKKAAEMLVDDMGISCKIARLFSIYGEGMPLNGQYALGQFIAQALETGKVRYYRGGSVRSYLHVKDVGSWLQGIVSRGWPKHPYDVGGGTAIKVEDLAHLVAHLCNVPCEEINFIPLAPICKDYLPNVERTKELLGVKETIPFEQGLKDVIDHCRAHLETPREVEGFALFDSGRSLTA